MNVMRFVRHVMDHQSLIVKVVDLIWKSKNPNQTVVANVSIRNKYIRFN